MILISTNISIEVYYFLDLKTNTICKKFTTDTSKVTNKILNVIGLGNVSRPNKANNEVSNVITNNNTETDLIMKFFILYSLRYFFH